MADKKYYWLKLKDNFFKDKEIKKLRRIAGGDTYTIIYLKLQLLSLKNEGKLLFDNLEDSFSEEMALELDEEVENVKVTLSYLHKCGLIEELSENEFILPQTIECIGGETQVASRVRRFRENQKALLGNGDVTNGNTEIEIDIDIKKEKELELKKDINTFYEHIWSLYPLKKGKNDVKDKQKKILYNLGEEVVTKCISRYVAEMKGKEDFYKHGSTFFNSGYVDYLDKNYQEIKPKPQPQQQYKKPQPGDSGKRQYDAAELERKLLGR